MSRTSKMGAMVSLTTAILWISATSISTERPTEKLPETWIRNPLITCISNYCLPTLPPPDFSRAFLSISGEVDQRVTAITVVGCGQVRTFERSTLHSGYARINLPCDENGMPAVDPTGRYAITLTDGSGHYGSAVATVERCLGDVDISVRESVPAESTVTIRWTAPEALYGTEPDSLHYEVAVYEHTMAPMDGPYRIWESGAITHGRAEIPPLTALSIRKSSNASISGWRYLILVKAEDEVGNRSYSSRLLAVE